MAAVGLEREDPNDPTTWNMAKTDLQSLENRILKGLQAKGYPATSVEMDASKLPEWNFDGSSTGQAPGDDSEVILKPQACYRDPFLGGDAILVMCDCYKPGSLTTSDLNFNMPFFRRYRVINT